MGEKTESVSRLAFLEEENKRLAEDRDRLKEERRVQEEQRWAALHTNLSTVTASVQALGTEVRETRMEIREAARSSQLLRVTVSEVQDEHKKTVKLLTSPEEPEKGLVYRVKQNEERHTEHIENHKENRKWWIGIGTLAFGTAIKTAWDLIFKRP
jgi:hypothetical protein